MRAFDYVGADARGIAVTSECTAQLIPAVPMDEAIGQFAQRVQKPPVYTAVPEYYHAKWVYGYFSLPGTQPTEFGLGWKASSPL